METNHKRALLQGRIQSQDGERSPWVHPQPPDVISFLAAITKHGELGGLKLKFTVSVLEAQSLKSGCQQGHAPSETCRGDPTSPGLLATFGVPWLVAA